VFRVVGKVCPSLPVFDLLGRKAVLRVVRELNVHKKLRFGELQAELGGLSAKTLSDRLRELAGEGLVTRKVYNEIPPRVEYSLTVKGRELVKGLRSVEEWAMKWDGK
jgi:DNA-binding HxlR family transcriptional regulator